MEWVVTPAAEKDVDAVERLYDAVNDHLAATVNYPGWRKGAYPAREDAEAGVAAGELFVARDGERIAGAVILNHAAEPEPVNGAWRVRASGGEALAVHTVAVHPAYLRRGVASALLAFTERLARERGAKALRLDVYEKNLPAIRMYEGCGYRYVDTVDIGLGSIGLDRFRLYEKVL